MRLTDLDTVTELKRELEAADRVVLAFQHAPPRVPVRAYVEGHNFGRGVHVDLLPVDSAIAISAAERERAKVAEKLRGLGVDVE